MHASCKQSHREIMFRFVFGEISISADSIEAKNFRLVKFRWSSFSCSQRPRKMKTISLDPDSALLWIAPRHCYTTLLSHFSSSSALLLIEKTSIFLWRRWVRFSSCNENLESINNCVMSVPMLAAFFVISFSFLAFSLASVSKENFTDGKTFSAKTGSRVIATGCRLNNGGNRALHAHVLMRNLFAHKRWLSSSGDRLQLRPIVSLKLFSLSPLE